MSAGASAPTSPAATLPDAAPSEELELFPLHLRERFERINREIETAYGSAPGAVRLARLWMASGTDGQVLRQFENAVMGCDKRTIEPNANGDYDDDCL